MGTLVATCPRHLNFIRTRIESDRSRTGQSYAYAIGLCVKGVAPKDATFAGLPSGGFPDVPWFTLTARAGFLGSRSYHIQ